MNIFGQINEPDRAAMEAATRHMDSLVKPLQSLGSLEEYVVRLAGIKRQFPYDLGKKAATVFAADNGIWEEGISPVPQEVTALQVQNMVNGITAINAFCRLNNADLFIADMGIKHPAAADGVLKIRIMESTGNIAKGPAMTRDDAIRAIKAGIEVASDLFAKGYGIIGVGEMGICNTSTAAAVIAALTGAPIDIVTGNGIGLTPLMFNMKKEAIKAALQVNKPDPHDALDVLSKVGGLDIAGMTGCILGCAINGIPAVIDGIISIAAALIAHAIDSAVLDYIFLSHYSAEPGYSIAAKRLGLKPALDLNMRLGEGTGSALMFSLLEAATCAANQMGTLTDGGVNPDDLV